MKRGKPRQAARGHKPREHVARKEREIEEEGLSRAQQETIRKWYGNKYNPHDSLGRADYDDVLELARSDGYEAFKTFRATWEAARRDYQKPGYKDKGPGYLLEIALNAGVPDVTWLYYR